MFRATEALLYPLQDWQRRLTQRSHQQIINQKEIRVVGMRRTGNHALLNWIAKQQPGEVFHLNNVNPGQNPYRQKSHRLLRYHPEHFKMAAVYGRQAKGEFIKRDCLIYSYEDWGLAGIAQPHFERNRSLYLGKSAQQFEVLILRDPFNLFASRIKQNFQATKRKEVSMVSLWLEYAREFVGKTHYLPGVICINYNRWFADVDYRRALAAQLGLAFSDAGLSEVSAFGAGSSFDGTQLNGQARAMDVTNRWRVFAEDPDFRRIFQNDEIWHYSEQIFGHLPGTEVLRAG